MASLPSNEITKKDIYMYAFNKIHIWVELVAKLGNFLHAHELAKLTRSFLKYQTFAFNVPKLLEPVFLGSYLALLLLSKQRFRPRSCVSNPLPTISVRERKKKSIVYVFKKLQLKF